MRHICKIEKHEIRAVINTSKRKGLPPKEIHEDSMETLWKEAECKKWAAEFKRERSCTPCLCVIGGETCEA